MRAFVWTLPIAVALLLGLLAALPPAQAQGFEREDFDFESWDGTMLKASVYVPESEGPFPVVLTTNGWNGHHLDDQVMDNAEQHAADGYLVVSWTSRGWGESEGQINLDGPPEVQDVSAVIDWVAQRADVRLDGPGDPRVGMVGYSYGGGIQLLAAQEDDRIDAIVPMQTWSDLLAGLAPDDVRKAMWVDLLYASGSATGNMMDDLHRWYATFQATNEPDEEIRAELGVKRSVRAGELATPTLLVQGWPDTLFRPSDALRTYHDLERRGVPVQLILYPGGHGGFNPGYDSTEHEGVDEWIDEWFRVHLRDEEPARPPYPVVRYRHHEADYVGETQWPPSGTDLQTRYLHAAGEGGLAAEPPGDEARTPLLDAGAPTACTEASNFQGDQGPLCPHGVQNTFASWTTEPLDDATEVTGTPFLRVSVAATKAVGETFLFAHLVDVGPDGEEAPVLSQTTAMRRALDDGEALVPLETVTHRFEAGHRIGLRLATSETSMASSREPGLVEVVSAAGDPSWLMLPVVPQDAWGDREAPVILEPHEGEALPAASVLTVQVDDNLGPVNISLEAMEGQDDAQRLDGSGGTATFRVPAPGAWRAHAVDLAGNAAQADFTVQRAPAGTNTTTGGAEASGTPAVPVALVAAALVLVAWRRPR